MADPSPYLELAKAIPVVVGGLLAVSGGVVTQLVTHHLTERRELRNLRRERLEALVKAIYAHEQWLVGRFQAIIFPKTTVRHRRSTKPRMIQTLHFPELSQEISDIMGAAVPLNTFIGEQNLARMKHPDAWIKAWNEKPYLDAYTVYRNTLTAMTLKAACSNLSSPRFFRRSLPELG